MIINTGIFTLEQFQQVMMIHDSRKHTIITRHNRFHIKMPTQSSIKIYDPFMIHSFRIVSACDADVLVNCLLIICLIAF